MYAHSLFCALVSDVRHLTGVEIVDPKCKFVQIVKEGETSTQASELK